MTRLIFALVVSAAAATAHADPIVVVPESNAGYLYFPAGAGGQRASNTFTLVVNKSGPNTHYRIVSEPPGLVIAEADRTGRYEFELGPVTLRLEGKYATQGLTNLQVAGVWSEDCVQEESSRSCTFTITRNAGVKVEVGHAPAPGSIIELPGEIEAMYAGFTLGRHYVLAHRQVGTSLAWHPSGEVSIAGARDRSDGLSNTAAMVAAGSPAARHCAGLTGPQIGSGWFVPAQNELALMLGLPVNAKLSLGLQKKAWSSTECKAGETKDCEKKAVSFEHDGGRKNELKDHDKKLDKVNEVSTVCFKAVS